MKRSRCRGSVRLYEASHGALHIVADVPGDEADHTAEGERPPRGESTVGEQASHHCSEKADQKHFDSFVHE